MNNLESKTLEDSIENELEMQTQIFEQKQKEIINNQIKEKNKEIERLNKDLQTAIDICSNRQKEIVRLNNIINELEEYILNHYIVGHTIQNASLDDIINKLKELKEGK